MAEITLKVTSRSLKYAIEEDNWNQAPIAIVSPAFEANGARTQEILLGGEIRFVVGDTHAIWYSHNNGTDRQGKDFKRLYALLANHPDTGVKFLYDLL